MVGTGTVVSVELDTCAVTSTDTPVGSDRTELARAGTGRRRATWSVLDQGLSSATNFGLAIVVARVASARELGAFEIVFSAYLFAVGCSRAVGTEPLLVRHSASHEAEVRDAAARTVGTAFVVGLISAVVCLMIAPLLGDPVANPLRALALMLPFLLVQDAWRYVFFAAGRPAKAMVNDGLWTIVQFGLVAWLLIGSDPTLTMLVLAWGASAAVGAIAGMGQARLWPRPLQVLAWLRAQRDFAPRFLGEFTVGTGASQLAIWLIGLVGGLRVLGALRGALVLIGPMRIFLAAAPGAAIPELVRLEARSRTRLRRSVAATSWGLTLMIAIWGFAVLLLPTHIGKNLLGDNWEPARRLLPLVTLAWAALGLGTGAMIGLRVLADARRSFRARLVISPFLVAVPPIAVLVGGATGAAAGLLIVSSLMAVAWWAYYQGALRERSHAD